VTPSVDNRGNEDVVGEMGRSGPEAALTSDVMAMSTAKSDTRQDDDNIVRRDGGKGLLDGHFQFSMI
jgi:hypothetical protein